MRYESSKNIEYTFCYSFVLLCYHQQANVATNNIPLPSTTDLTIDTLPLMGDVVTTNFQYFTVILRESGDYLSSLIDSDHFYI